MNLAAMGRLSAAALMMAIWSSVPLRADEAQADLARQARQVFNTYCHRCHGQDGAVEGGFNYVTDLGRLVERRKVVAGQPDASPLFKKVAAGKMPPPGVEPRLTEAELALLRRWIETGAPRVAAPVARPFLREAEVMARIVTDLDKLDRRSRRFSRYFSLASLANAGLSEDELQTYRNALAKLLNCLSWHPRITLPTAIDQDRLIYRIDLRDFVWDANLWNRILAEYPYGVFQDTAAARIAAVATATRLPVVRADWFIATACHAPLYHDLLQLPNNATELERQLRVDVQLNLQQERVARAGFNSSGISRNNRLIERHDAAHGAYWRTYDFEAIAQNLTDRTNLLPDRRNLFAYPFGPGISDNQFQHAGGEIIFNLPNGLQGYMLVNANNQRIDKGPLAIVSDPKRPDRAVETAVSCIACHYRGINPKSDQIRAHVEKNPRAFSKADAELIRALYVPDEKMKALMDEDMERFRKAVEKTGNTITAAEPIMAVTLRYEADMDLAAAATELDLTPKELLMRLVALKDASGTSPSSTLRNLGPLKLPGGVVSRQLFVQSFGDIVKEFRLGVLFNAALVGQALPDNSGEIDPLEAQSSPANAIAFSQDGKKALFASADKTVRVWDIDAGREVRRLIGHRASVWSVAFSPDGTQAISGGMDGTVRLWDVDTGREIRRLGEHQGLVTATAFSPDGRRVLSGGYDHLVLLTDVETGNELRRWESLARYVNAIAFTADGGRAVVAGEKTIHVVDLKSGEEVRTLEGHTQDVVDVAVSPDGRLVLSAGDDGTVRLWDLGGGRVMRSFMGHSGPVKSVAFSPDGKRALTGGADHSVRYWDVETGQELKTFGKHEDGVVRVAFAAEGRLSLSGGRDAVVQPWWVIKAGSATPVNPPDVPATTPAPVELKPAAVIPIGGTVGGMFLSPDGKALYYLNLTEGRAGKITLASLKKEKEFRFQAETALMGLSRDGKGLYLIEATGTDCLVQQLDPASLVITRTARVTASPYDLAVRDDGLLFLSGGTGEWTEVTVVDMERRDVIARWGGIWTKSLLQLNPDQDRLYVATQGVSPGTVEVLPLPGKLAEKPTGYRFAAPDKHALGGEFLITPDGKYLLAKTGTVLRLSPNREEDLQLVTKLERFAAAAVDPERGVAFLLGGDGTLRHFSFPDFKLKSTHKIGIVAYQATLDSRNGKLCVAGFDPAEVGGRPRARGFGNVYVFDVRALLPAQ